MGLSGMGFGMALVPSLLGMIVAWGWRGCKGNVAVAGYALHMWVRRDIPIVLAPSLFVCCLEDLDEAGQPKPDCCCPDQGPGKARVSAGHDLAFDFVLAGG